MAHLAPKTAIFSPTAARAAASTAKDWSYVDGWLKRIHGRTPPSFERNPETLQVLLSLASANEAADEEREQLASIETAALNAARAAETDRAARRAEVAASAEGDGTPLVDGELIAGDILDALEEGLSREGRAALDAMSEMAVELGVAHPTPENLSAKFVELQGKAVEVDATIERVALLQKYLDREAGVMENFIQELQSEAYQPESDLSKQNLDLQRKVKAMSAKLPELKQHVAAMEKAIGMPDLTVEDVRQDEEEYLRLLSNKKDLDAQVKAFAGLPPDVEAARLELEGLRSKLRGMTERRDANFEQLVERESPVKNRRRP
jgi:HAUS augmin-like complex subunit 1